MNKTTSHLTTSLLLVMGLTLQSCTLCKIITYPIVFLLTSTEVDKIPEDDLPFCKAEEEIENNIAIT